MRLAEENYRVDEFDRVVNVCVERIGQSSEPIEVTIMSRERSPASATGECESELCFQYVLLGHVSFCNV